MIDSITKEQAIERIGGKREYVHCFRNPAGMLLGADWEWAQFVDALDNAPNDGIALSGEQAEAMRHPIAVMLGGGEWVFFGDETT